MRARLRSIQYMRRIERSVGFLKEPMLHKLLIYSGQTWDTYKRNKNQEAMCFCGLNVFYEISEAITFPLHASSSHCEYVRKLPESPCENSFK